MMFPEINARMIPGIVCNNRGAMYRALKNAIELLREEIIRGGTGSSPILSFLRMPRRSK